MKTLKHTYGYLMALLFALLVFAASAEWAHAIGSQLQHKQTQVYSGHVTSLNTASPICHGCPAGWSVTMGTGFIINIIHNLNLTNPSNAISCSVQPYAFSPQFMIGNYSNSATFWGSAVYNPALGSPQSGTLTAMNFICHVKT